MKQRWVYIPTSIFFIALLIVGSFFDLEISKNFVHLNSFTCRFITSIGELPLTAGLVFISGLIFGLLSNTNYKKSFYVFFYSIAVIAILLSVYFQGSEFIGVNAWNILQDKNIFIQLLVATPIGAAFVTPFFILAFFLTRNKNDKKLLVIAAIILFTAAISQVALNVVKIIMQRPRYRFLIDPELNKDEIPFFNWWERYSGSIDKNLKEEFKSFPSGHTVSASSSMLFFPLLGLLFPKFKKHNVSLYILGFIVTIVVAISRIRIGGHFLSDIAFSSLFGCFFNFICNEIIYRFKKRRS